MKEAQSLGVGSYSWESLLSGTLEMHYLLDEPMVWGERRKLLVFQFHLALDFVSSASFSRASCNYPKSCIISVWLGLMTGHCLLLLKISSTHRTAHSEQLRPHLKYCAQCKRYTFKVHKMLCLCALCMKAGGGLHLPNIWFAENCSKCKKDACAPVELQQMGEVFVSTFMLIDYSSWESGCLSECASILSLGLERE